MTKSYKHIKTTTITIRGNPKVVYVVAVGGKVKVSTAKLYPFNHIRKQNNKLKLEETNNICERCGKPAVEVHHRDMMTFNHELSNLETLCESCHRRLHKVGRKKNPNTVGYVRKNSIVRL